MRSFRWDGPCDTPDPDGEAPRDLDFINKTHTELARLTAEARAVRRGTPAHPVCADRYPCRHCAKIRDISHLINDHLDQLEAAVLDMLLAESEPS